MAKRLLFAHLIVIKEREMLINTSNLKEIQHENNIDGLVEYYNEKKFNNKYQNLAISYMKQTAQILNNNGIEIKDHEDALKYISKELINKIEKKNRNQIYTKYVLETIGTELKYVLDMVSFKENNSKEMNATG